MTRQATVLLLKNVCRGEWVNACKVRKQKREEGYFTNSKDNNRGLTSGRQRELWAKRKVADKVKDKSKK